MNNWYVETVLVTGAAGFLGRHVLNMLATSEHPPKKIVGLDKCKCSVRSCEWVVCDVTNEPKMMEIIREISPDGIIHFAGVTRASDLHSYFKANVLGCANILKTAITIRKQPRIIVVGTAAQYGFSKHDSQPVSEESPLEGTQPYDVSKILQEKWALVYARSEDLPVCCVRIFNALGPGQPHNLAPAAFLKQVVDVLESRQNEICVGDTDTKRDFTDARDIARALQKLLVSDKFAGGEYFNIASGKPVRISEMLRACIELSGRRDIPVTQDTTRIKSGDVQSIVGDVSKLRTVIDWQPRIHWRQSLQDMWREIKDQNLR